MNVLWWFSCARYTNNPVQWRSKWRSMTETKEMQYQSFTGTIVSKHSDTNVLKMYRNRTHLWRTDICHTQNVRTWNVIKTKRHKRFSKSTDTILKICCKKWHSKRSKGCATVVGELLRACGASSTSMTTLQNQRKEWHGHNPGMKRVCVGESADVNTARSNNFRTYLNFR